MLEKQIEKRVCDFAKVKGLLCYKFVSPGNAGVPDRMFVLPNGAVFFIEFKQFGKKPTPLQEREALKLAIRGCLVFVIDNVTDGLVTIQRMVDQC